MRYLQCITPSNYNWFAFRMLLCFAAVFFLMAIYFSPYVQLYVAGIAFNIAGNLGCTLHEGYPNGCIWLGVDVGPFLYALLLTGLHPRWVVLEICQVLMMFSLLELMLVSMRLLFCLINPKSITESE